LNDKERFVNVLKFKNVDRIPNIEIGTWPQTMENWIKEGLPEEANDSALIRGSNYFNLDGVEMCDIDSWFPYPKFKEKLISEDERCIIFTDEIGRTRKALKVGAVNDSRLCMDQYIDFPVKDKKSFLIHKKYYEGNFNKRYPENWNKLKDYYNNTDRPLMLFDTLNERFGYYAILRSWIGTEELSYMFYDNPSLIYEICEFLTEWVINLLDKAVKEVKFDYIGFDEDIAFKTGPLVSPDMFKKFFLPGYKKVTEFLRLNGINISMVGTDGNFDLLIPLFLEAGVNMFQPVEVAAGMDPVKLRKKYGKSFSMLGGIDKREISKGEKEINNELKKLIPVIDNGGYIPTIDHAIPPDISLKNFKYYLKIKSEILG